MRPGTKKSQVLFLLRPHTIQELDANPAYSFTLGLLSFNAWAVEPPSTVPFAKRYDPASITTASRAREVIAAYDNEKRVWENWYKEETAQCYRNFL